MKFFRSIYIYISSKIRFPNSSYDSVNEFKKDNDNYQKNWIFDGEKSLNYNGHIINKIWNTIDNEYFLNISGDLDYNKFEANFSRTEKIETFSGNKKEIEDKFKIKIS